MTQSTSLRQKLGTLVQIVLRQATTGGVLSIIQADQAFAAKRFLHLCEYHLCNVFDLLRDPHSSTKLRNARSESAR